ncbi:MAG: YebC/PmpR family DNA-binding transcriptional regulator, partial [Spirochaetales bacterium]|nr:YebC/PmpR family DNA-binding transcriptional regulator [Spirochaetales bacterium]
TGGGNLGESGSVSYLFKRKGVLTYDGTRYSEDDIFSAALEAGAEDVTSFEDFIEVTTDPNDFETVLNVLTSAGFQSEEAGIQKVAETKITLDNEKTGKVLNLIERIEDNDDVQEVFTNMEIPDDYTPEE